MLIYKMDIATQVSVDTGTHETEVKDHFKTVTLDDLRGWWVIEDFLFSHTREEGGWRKVKGLLEDAPAPPAAKTTIYDNIYKIVKPREAERGGKKKRKTKKRKSSNKKKSNKKKSNKKKSSKKRRTKRR